MGRNRLSWLRARRAVGIGVFLAGAVVVLASCYPGGPTDIAELDTVVTVYDPEYDFQKNKTYAMPQGWLLLTVTLPPCASAIYFTSVSPSPLPFTSRDSTSSTR